jgi:hypothetical protein
MTNVIVPPATNPELKEGQHRHYPYLIAYSARRVLWVVAQSVREEIEPPVKTWVIADNEGETKRVIVGTFNDLPADVRKLFSLKPKRKGI